MSYTETRALSVAKERQSVKAVQPVYLRQGDCGMTIRGELTFEGQPYEVPDDVSFKAMNAAGEYVSADAKVPSGMNADGIVEWTVTSALTAKAGKTLIAYFEMAEGGGVYTSDAIPIVVYKAADMTADAASGYQSEIDYLIDQFRGVLADAEAGDFFTVIQTPSEDPDDFPLLSKVDSQRQMVTDSTAFSAGVTVCHGTGTVKASSFEGSFTGTLHGNAGTATEAAHATSADTATSADAAKSADYATSAGSAGSAYTAATAYALDEQAIDNYTIKLDGSSREAYAAYVEEAGHAASADEASKLLESGVDNSTIKVDSATGQIYATSTGGSGGGTVNDAGGVDHPVYTAGGEVLACSADVGDESHPVYMYGGEICECTEIAATVFDLGGTKGDINQPVYLVDNKITPCSADVGDQWTPVYMRNGVIQKCQSIESGISIESLTGGNYISDVGGTLDIAVNVRNSGGEATAVTLTAEADEDIVEFDTVEIASVPADAASTTPVTITATGTGEGQTAFRLYAQGGSCARFVYVPSFEIEVAT